MNVLGITLARGGSRGVPGKHVRNLGGRPVIAWTVDEALRCPYLDDYAVSSDDPGILAAANRGNVALIARPAALAQDDTPTLPALVHAVATREEQLGGRFDYIVELRATAPFKTADDISACIRLLHDSGADSVIGVAALSDHHPARIKQIVDGLLEDWPGCPEPASGRRQDCVPDAYIRNGSIYAFRRSAIMERGGKIFGHARSLPYIMPAARSVNIDTEMDWLLAKALVAERLTA